MKIKSPRKLRSEDFPKEQQAAFEPVISTLNSFYDDFTFLTNKRIGSDNINWQIAEIDVKTTAGSLIENPISLRLNLTTRGVGAVVLNATNKTNSSVYPSGTPFISAIFSDGFMKIQNITSLGASASYKLTVLILGE